jgi:ClpP class serine protease
MLDPFVPVKEDDVVRLKAIQDEIHEMFINLVRTSRGDRLSGPDGTLFSGEYWTAKKGMEYGLLDRLIDLRSFLRERYGDKVVTPLITEGRSLFGWRKPGVGQALTGAGAFAAPEHLGFGLVDELISAIESRSIWSRYGL